MEATCGFEILYEECTPAKKARQGRRSVGQLEYMVDYFIENPHVPAGRFTGMRGRESLTGSWEELARALNNLRKPGTKEKNVKSWKECWRDLKSKTCKKAAALRLARRETGNQPIAINPLNDFEKKILGIIGWDYAEGMVDCPDSFPEEQCGAIMALSGGDENPLCAEPAPMTGREVAEQDFLDLQIFEGVRAAETERTSATSQAAGNPENDFEETPVPAIETPARRTNRAQRRLSSQFSEARKSFSLLATRNEENMERLAKAVEEQGTSNLRLCKAVEEQASSNAMLANMMKEQMEVNKMLQLAICQQSEATRELAKAIRKLCESK